MKAWIYQPRNRPAEVHLRRDTFIDEINEEIDWAINDGSYWEIRTDYIFVDDGGHASLVEVIE
jgi:hypothetical protein